MPPAGRGTGHAGIAVMPCAGVQASRQPSPARPCGCVRLRGSTSCRRRKRSSPAPVRPKGAPPWASGPSADSRFAARPPWPSGFGRCSRPVPGATSLRLDAPGTGPCTGSSLPTGRAGRPLRGDRPVPPASGTFLLPGPGRLRCADCRSLGDAAGFATAKIRGRFARPCKHDAERRAVGRQTLRADCLGPPASLSLPAPGATSLRSDAPDRGLPAVGVATARPRGRSARLLIGAPFRLPDSSFVGDRRPRAIIFLPSSGRHLRDAPPRRSP